MREDDLLHVVGHEEVVEAPALIPLHEGLLRPERTAGQSERLRLEGRAGAPTPEKVLEALLPRNTGLCTWTQTLRRETDGDTKQPC